MNEMIHVTSVEPQPRHQLLLQFSNGDQGTLSLPNHLPFVGYFAPLTRPEVFAKVYLDHGTLCWPGGIDLDPIVVHAWTMGLPLSMADEPPVPAENF